jgi:hypothetical protein
LWLNKLMTNKAMLNAWPREFAIIRKYKKQTISANI